MSASQGVTSKRKLRIFCALGFVAIVAFACLILFTLDERRVKWLDAAGLERASKPGKFEQAKNSAKQWLDRTLHRKPAPSHIMLYGTVWQRSSLDPTAAGLGSPTATNSAGTRVWVLSESATSALEKLFHTATNLTVIERPRILETNGGLIHIATGPLGPPYAPRPASMVRGTFVSMGTPSIGNLLEITLRVSFNTHKLLIRIDTFEPQTNSKVKAVQEFVAACQVSIRNGESIVIDCGKPELTNGLHRWILLHPYPADDSDFQASQRDL